EPRLLAREPPLHAGRHRLGDLGGERRRLLRLRHPGEGLRRHRTRAELMRRGQLIGLIVAALLGLATAAAGALAADDPPHIQRAAAASGALALSNSREGAAIFAAHDLRPGDEISGTLTLGNTGDKPGRLLLSRANLVESPGLGGGRLSDVLTMRVEDITSGAPADVVTGTLRGMQNVLLRDLPGGATRTYRFVVG